MSKGTQTLGLPPRLHPRPIHYGVELEFVFAFRQDELQLDYTDGVEDTLRKNLRYFEREVYPKFTRIDPRALPVRLCLY